MTHLGVRDPSSWLILRTLRPAFLEAPPPLASLVFSVSLSLKLHVQSQEEVAKEKAFAMNNCKQNAALKRVALKVRFKQYLMLQAITIRVCECECECVC